MIFKVICLEIETFCEKAEKGGILELENGMFAQWYNHNITLCIEARPQSDDSLHWYRISPGIIPIPYMIEGLFFKCEPGRVLCYYRMVTYDPIGPQSSTTPDNFQIYKACG